MAAQAQVALRQRGLRQQRNAGGRQRGSHGERGAAGIQPYDSDGRKRNFKESAQKPPRQLGRLAKLLHTMAALRHIGYQAALKIAVAQQGDLLQEA